MKFDRNTVLVVLGGVMAVVSGATDYLQSGQPFNWTTFATALVGALVAFVAKRPGDLTRAQADRLAEARARDRVAIAREEFASNPPPPVGPTE